MLKFMSINEIAFEWFQFQKLYQISGLQLCCFSLSCRLAIKSEAFCW